MESNGFAEALTTLQPVITKAEVAFVTPIIAVNEVAKAALDDPGAESHKPDKGDRDGQHQSPDAISVMQMCLFQIKAMALHVTEHLLDPHAYLIEAKQLLRARLVRNKVPGIVFAFFPMQQQPVPTGIVRFRQAHPTNGSSLSWFQWDGVDATPSVVVLPHIQVSPLANDQMPALAADPLEQRCILKTAIAHDPDLGPSRYQGAQAAKQGQFMLEQNGAALTRMNRPDEGQASFAVGDANDEQRMVKAYLGGVDCQPQLLVSESLEQELGQRLVPGLDINPLVAEKTAQAVRQARCLPTYRPLLDNSREVNAHTQEDTGDRQRQIPLLRNPFARMPLADSMQHFMVETKVVSHLDLLG